MASSADYQSAWAVGITFGTIEAGSHPELLPENNPSVMAKFSANPNFSLLGLEVSFSFSGANPNPCGKGAQGAFPSNAVLSAAFEGGCFVGLGYPLKQHTE
jgi:hypothetical protein